MKYYYIEHLNILAKGEPFATNYILKDGEWVEDVECIVSDRLIGYDPYEEDPAYRIGNREVMSEIKEISEDEFKKLLATQSSYKSENL